MISYIKRRICFIILLAGFFASMSAHQYDIETKKLTAKDGLKSNTVNCMIQDSQGYIWFGTDNGLNRFDGYELRGYDPKEEIKELQIKRIKEDKKNKKLIINTRDGRVYFFDLKTSAFSTKAGGSFRKAEEKEDSVPVIVKLDEITDIIPTTGEGIYLHNKKNGTTIHLTKETHPNIIDNNNITNFMVDRSGCIWIAEEFLGVKCLKFNSISYQRSMLDSKSKNPEVNNIRCIKRGNWKTLLITNNAGGVFILDESTEKMTQAEQLDHVANVAFMDKGKLWIGTEGGGLWIGKTLYKKGTLGLPSSTVNDIISDKKGQVWVGFKDGGIGKAVKNEDGENRFLHYLGNNTVYSMVIDKDGLIWAATDLGICILDTEAPLQPLQFNTENKTLPFDRIAYLHVDKDGHIWAGTRGGGLLKCSFDGKKLSYSSYSIEDGLESNNILSINEDHKGNLWMSTDAGLISLNPKTEEVRNYKTSDDPLGDVFNQNACVINRRDHLLLGSHQGMVEIVARKLAGDKMKAVTYLTLLEVNGKELDASLRSIDIDEEENTINMKFSNFLYASIDNVNYQFYLEGVDKDWRPITQDNKISYYNLKSGKYIFHLKSDNGYGEWGDEMTMSFYVDRPGAVPTWLLWILCIFGALVLIAAAILLFAKISEILNDRKRNRETERKAKAREEKAAVAEVKEEKTTPAPEKKAAPTQEKKVEPTPEPEKKTVAEKKPVTEKKPVAKKKPAPAKQPVQEDDSQPIKRVRWRSNKEFLDGFSHIITTELTQPGFSVEKVSDMLGMEMEEFITKVKNLTGKSPFDHILKAKIEMAAQMLSTTNISIEQIRKRCGFSNTTFFVNNFTRIMGQDPSTYRNENKKSK